MADAQSPHSPRIMRLRVALAAGDTDALAAFWRELEVAGTPLVAPLAHDAEHALVTFLRRGRLGEGLLALLGTSRVLRQNTARPRTTAAGQQARQKGSNQNATPGASMSQIRSPHPHSVLARAVFDSIEQTASISSLGITRPRDASSLIYYGYRSRA